MDNVETSYCRFCAEMTPINKLYNLLIDREKSREVVGKLVILKHDFISIFRDTKLPQTVCFLCLDALYRAVAFVQRVEASQVTLKSVFILQNIKKEPSNEVEDESPSGVVGNENRFIKTEMEHSNDPDTSSSSSSPSSSSSADEGGREMDCVPVKKKQVQYKRRTVRKDGSEDKSTWREYTWMCAFCKTYFNSAEDLQSHSMEYHNSCTAYKCIDCNIRKLKLEPFIAHVVRHRKHLRRFCYACNFRFYKKKDAEMHRSAHVKHKNYCPGCLTSFKRPADLDKHKNKYYTDKRATRDMRPITEQDLTCNVCDKRFKTRAILQGHLLIHTDRSRDYTCDICGKCFYNKDTLTSHLVVHDDTRPYICEICKFAFKTIGQLRTHIGTHDGNKPFACETCGKRFRLRKNLTSHMVTHSDTLPHVCEFCSKAFRFKTILNQHIRQHTGVKPYSCNLCQRSFTNWSNYNKHMKRRHGLETAKKKHTPDGVFPIDPVTGEVIISPTSYHTEEWKKSVLKRKLIKTNPNQPREQPPPVQPNMGVTDMSMPTSLAMSSRMDHIVRPIVASQFKPLN